MDDAFGQVQVQPGLWLFLTDTIVEKPCNICREQRGCACLTVLLDGFVRFSKPESIDLCDRRMVACVGAGSILVDASIAATPRLRCIDIMVEADWFDDPGNPLAGDEDLADLRQALKSPRPVVVALPRPAHIEALAESLFDRALSDGGALAQARRLSVSHELLACLAANIGTPPAAEDPGGLADLVDHRIRNAPEHTSNIENLAQEFGVSPSKLKRHYHSRFGMSIGAARRTARLEKAHEMITSGHQVSSAGYEIGYRHASSFTRAFRRQFGYAPSDL